MKSLHIAVLGTPQVIYGEQTLSFTTRKELALLIYLAVEGGAHTRQQLSELFWPEADSEHARSSLRSVLMRLRHHFEQLAVSPKETPLKITGKLVQLVESPHIEIDTQLLLQAYSSLSHMRSGYAFEPADISTDTTTRLEMALASYRGHFLEGFSLADAPIFDDWVRQQNDYWHQRFFACCQQLVLWYEQAGQWDQAIATTKRWLKADPFYEEVHRQLMRLYMAKGDRHAALLVYEQCRLLFEEELGAQLMPETQMLASQLRAATVPLYTPSSPTQTATPPTQIDTPLVGRGSEFTVLMASYNQAQMGHPQFVLLEGEAGIGKTRLAHDFLHWTLGQGAEVLYGHAYETGEWLPYNVLVSAVRPQLEQKQAHQLAEVWLSELTRLFPELQTRYPGLSTHLQEDVAGQARLFEAVARLFSLWTNKRPLVLLLDDLQWVDTATLHLITYLAQHWRKHSQPVLLIVCLRSELLTENEMLQRWLFGLRRILTQTQLSLKPLSADETIRLYAGLAKFDLQVPTVSPALKEEIERIGNWLYQETAGQPFYLVATLEMLLQEGVLYWQPTAGNVWRLALNTTNVDAMHQLFTRLPTSVREVIRQRIYSLSQGVQHLLQAAAVLGQHFHVETVFAVAAFDEDKGLELLDEAERHQVVRAETDSYTFAHDKVRQVLYSEISEARRRLLHRRTFLILKEQQVSASVLAYHAQQAGLPETAFHYCLQAGMEAMRVFAFYEAIVYYEQAMQIVVEHWHGQEQVATTTLEQLYVQLGLCYELTRSWKKARELYHNMGEQARVHQNLRMECIALSHLATLGTHHAFDLTTVPALLLEGERAEQKGDRWQLTYIGAEREAWNPTSALAAADRALELAAQLGIPELMARNLNTRALIHGTLGNWAEEVEAAATAAALFAEQNNRVMETDSLQMLAQAHINLGQLEQALNAARQASSQSHELQHAWLQASSSYTLALALLDNGDYEEALLVARQGIEIARAQAITPWISGNLGVLGDILLTLFMDEEALASYHEAWALRRSIATVEQIALRLALVHAQQESWHEATQYAMQALALSDHYRRLSSDFIGGGTEIVALLKIGEREQAEKAVMLQEGEARSSRRFSLSYLLSQAALARHAQVYDQAIHYLQEALQVAREIGLPGEEWRILASLGDLYQTQGMAEQAWQAFVQAAAIIIDLAERFRDMSLCARFLQAPRVQYVLRAATKEEAATTAEQLPDGRQKLTRA